MRGLAIALFAIAAVVWTMGQAIQSAADGYAAARSALESGK